MPELCREGLEPAVGEMDLAGEPFLELDAAALLLAALDGAVEGGSVG